MGAGPSVLLAQCAHFHLVYTPVLGVSRCLGLGAAGLSIQAGRASAGREERPDPGRTSDLRVLRAGVLLGCKIGQLSAGLLGPSAWDTECCFLVDEMIPQPYSDPLHLAPSRLVGFSKIGSKGSIRKSVGSEARQLAVLDLPYACCVILNKWLSSSEPQFPPL